MQPWTTLTTTSHQTPSDGAIHTAQKLRSQSNQSVSQSTTKYPPWTIGQSSSRVTNNSASSRSCISPVKRAHQTAAVRKHQPLGIPTILLDRSCLETKYSMKILLSWRQSPPVSPCGTAQA